MLPPRVHLTASHFGGQYNQLSTQLELLVAEKTPNFQTGLL